MLVHKITNLDSIYYLVLYKELCIFFDTKDAQFFVKKNNGLCRIILILFSFAHNIYWDHKRGEENMDSCIIFPNLTLKQSNTKHTHFNVPHSTVKIDICCHVQQRWITRTPLMPHDKCIREEFSFYRTQLFKCDPLMRHLWVRANKYASLDLHLNPSVLTFILRRWWMESIQSLIPGSSPS